MGTLLQDIRFSVRSLRRAPAFPLAAIATLALGIGATTAIFSTLNAVLLKPLPYPHAEDLYNMRTALTDGRVTSGFLSNGELQRLNQAHISVVQAAGVNPAEFTLLHQDGTPQHVTVFGVTEGFFDLFSLPMTLGGFTHNDFAAPAPPQPGTPPPPPTFPKVVISYDTWRTLYNSDPNVVGKPLRFAEFPSTVAGVAPRDFDTPHGAEFWLNIRVPTEDINHSLDGYMRLKAGTSLDRANSEMAAVMKGLERDFPQADKNRIYVTKPLVAAVVGDLGPILIIVMAATGLLLLLACVNVTNLLLARGAARGREMAVRVALGAGRGRIVRQLLTESVVLSTAGALLGVLVAYFSVRGLMALGASKLPRLDGVAFDGRVFLFALVVLIVSGLLVGFAPALRLAGTDVRTLMNESTRSASGGRGTSRWLSTMTVAEVALAIMLVAGAGWLVRGFAVLRATNLGFTPSQRLLFDVSYLGPKYPNGDAVVAASRSLADQLRSIAGVSSVAATSNFPLRNTTENSLLLQFLGQPFDSVRPMGTRQRFVSADYFKATGTKLIEGRDFGIDDRLTTTPVALVNKTFVERYLGGKDPLGVQFAAGYPTPNPNQMNTVVGVVDDVRQKTVVDAAEPAFYSPLAQNPIRRQTMVVEAAGLDPTQLQSAIRQTIHRFDPQVAVEFQLATALVASTISRQELGMTLMLIFGGVAILLAAVGIYGVVAYAVSQRRNEMATRLALGASPVSVFNLILKQGLFLAAVGTAIGLSFAYLSGKVVSSQIYAIQASDPLMLTGAIVVVTVVVLVATMIPAWRACRLSPSGVLRTD